MDPKEYNKRYTKSLSRGSSLGTMDFMEQEKNYGNVGLGYVGNTTSNGSGMTITTSTALPQATAYTLTSALGMK